MVSMPGVRPICGRSPRVTRESASVWARFRSPSRVGCSSLVRGAASTCSTTRPGDGHARAFAENRGGPGQKLSTGTYGNSVRAGAGLFVVYDGVPRTVLVYRWRRIISDQCRNDQTIDGTRDTYTQLAARQNVVVRLSAQTAVAIPERDSMAVVQCFKPSRSSRIIVAAADGGGPSRLSGSSRNLSNRSSHRGPAKSAESAI